MGKINHHDYLPLFESKSARGRTLYRLFLATIFMGIGLIFVYRVRYMPSKEEGLLRLWAWIGMFLSELYFTLSYFITNVVVRWNPIYRRTFKDRLSLRYDEKLLPGVDIFVCTADPKAEPPLMVINTVLSMMAYNYPPEKLSVYLSDDGGSDLIFYALLEASRFSKAWLPFCRKFRIEPRSPEAYFQTASQPLDDDHDKWISIKKLYEDMKTRIESTTKVGRISEAIREQHKGFREWDFVSSKRDHQTILQIFIDGRDPKAVDIEGQPLPTLVYLSREKRPQYHHNFKAGAMNALIRVSSQISNAPIILNVDCDMYSNNSESVRDALCFFLDEEKGHEVAFIQFPQAFENIIKNDLYGAAMRLSMEVEFRGFDANGGTFYIGTGCFHRRESISGKKYKEATKALVDWKSKIDMGRPEEISAEALEETTKPLASCTYELENTQWGKEMGLMYNCLVEDVKTGLVTQCRGWRSVYCCPERKAFLGTPTITLLHTLLQYKRWSEGNFQILLSRHCPLTHGIGRIPLLLRLSYLCFEIWSPASLASLYYVYFPSLFLLKGISLFPQLSDIWIVPFIYVFLTIRAYSLGEMLVWGGTYQEWVNEQRMWLYKRTTSFLFSFLNNFLRQLGFSESAFTVTEKVVDDDVSKRYEQELMEFGVDSPMFTILATFTLVNAFGFIWGLKRLAFSDQSLILNPFALQAIYCGMMVFINLTILRAMFLRKDKGRMPSSVTYRSIIFVLVACSIALY